MKVSIEYDSDTKLLVVKEDGVEMPAICNVSFYKRYCDEGDNPNKFTMDICQEGKQNGVTKRVYTIAKMLGFKDEN